MDAHHHHCHAEGEAPDAGKLDTVPASSQIPTSASHGALPHLRHGVLEIEAKEIVLDEIHVWVGKNFCTPKMQGNAVR
ncbi:MAG: hypothetical protein R3C54_08545 [Parvularculaceae bacterium]